MKIYFAGPLFCQAEVEFNSKVTAELRRNGFDVYLPQENSKIDVLPDTRDGVEEMLCGFFADDIRAIDSADILLILLDGRVPDEGACFELGYAYAKGKICAGLKTDSRVSELGTDNAMILGPLRGRIAGDIPALIAMLKEIVSSA